jgi:hypothetical protein
MRHGNRVNAGRQWLLCIAALAGLAMLYGAPRIVLGGLLAILVLSLGLFAAACFASGCAQADPNRAVRRQGATRDW